MPWVALDDQIFYNKKLVRCDPNAKLLYIAGLVYCGHQLTDGYIAHEALTLLAGMTSIELAIAKQNASKLCSELLWVDTGDAWHVPDYLDYNPSKEQVLHKKTVRQEAGRRGGQAKSANKLANAKQMLEQNASKIVPPTPSPISSSSAIGIADVHRLFIERFYETFGHQPPVQAGDDGTFAGLVKAGITLQQIDHAIASSLDSFQRTNANPYPKSWRYCLPAMQRAVEPSKPKPSRNGNGATLQSDGIAEENSRRMDEAFAYLVAQGSTPDTDRLFYPKVEEYLAEHYGKQAIISSR